MGAEEGGSMNRKTTKRMKVRLTFVVDTGVDLMCTVCDPKIDVNALAAHVIAQMGIPERLGVSEVIVEPRATLGVALHRAPKKKAVPRG